MLSNNLDAVISFIMMAGTAIGAWFGGKKSVRGDALGEAASTVALMREEINTLKSKLQDREQELAELRGRLRTLEEMVTQRADVEGVRQVVEQIREAVVPGE